MKVRELIDYLATCDPNLEVVVSDLNSRMNPAEVNIIKNIYRIYSSSANDILVKILIEKNPRRTDLI